MGLNQALWMQESVVKFGLPEGLLAAGPGSIPGAGASLLEPPSRGCHAQT